MTSYPTLHAQHQSSQHSLPALTRQARRWWQRKVQKRIDLQASLSIRSVGARIPRLPDLLRFGGCSRLGVWVVVWSVPLHGGGTVVARAWGGCVWRTQLS